MQEIALSTVKRTRRHRELFDIIAHLDPYGRDQGTSETQLKLQPAFQLKHPASPPTAFSSPDLSMEKHDGNKPQTANTFAIANRDFLSQF
jgi:hypothetical protein